MCVPPLPRRLRLATNVTYILPLPPHPTPPAPFSTQQQTYSEGRFNPTVPYKAPDGAPTSEIDLRSKIVLLTISFPRLRTIWSSSPYQTVDIFRDLKENREEPDLDKAVSVGVDEAASEGTGEAGMAFAPQEVLRTLPGITTTNYRYVMGKVENVEELCGMGLEGVQGLVGAEKGRTLWGFMNRDLLANGGEDTL